MPVVDSMPPVLVNKRRRVLAIDPGSRSTGYGIVDIHPGQLNYVASGCIQAARKGDRFTRRLGEIYSGICEIIESYEPDEFAVEEVFMAKNPQAALKLGQARGAAIAAGVAAELPIHEYAARQVKQAVVGSGKASKEQVQHMVQVMLKLSGVPQADAADALAIALCHANFQEVTQKQQHNLAVQGDHSGETRS